MATASEEERVQNRGLLTSDDRAFFEGEKDTDTPDKTRREKLYNVRRRIEHIAEDIDILREAGEDETVEKFYGEIGRYERLEKQLRELEQKVEDDEG